MYLRTLAILSIMLSLDFFPIKNACSSLVGLSIYQCQNLFINLCDLHFPIKLFHGRCEGCNRVVVDFFTKQFVDFSVQSCHMSLDPLREACR